MSARWQELFAIERITEDAILAALQASGVPGPRRQNAWGELVRPPFVVVLVQSAQCDQHYSIRSSDGQPFATGFAMEAQVQVGVRRSGDGDSDLLALAGQVRYAMQRLEKMNAALTCHTVCFCWERRATRGDEDAANLETVTFEYSMVIGVKAASLPALP